MDYETTADLNEAHYYAGLDADMEMAAMLGEAARNRALRRRGICTHGSRLGGGVNFYSAEDIAASLATGEFKNRGGFTGAQTDIPAGKDLVRGAGRGVTAMTTRSTPRARGRRHRWRRSRGCVAARSGAVSGTRAWTGSRRADGRSTERSASREHARHHLSSR